MAQQEYWDSVPSHKRRSIRQWSCQFLRLWFQFLKDQWQHRNDQVHNIDKEKNKKKQEEKLKTKVNLQFSLGLNNLRSQDEYIILDNTKEHIMKLDIKRKAQWVDQIEIARKKIKISESAELPRMRQLMRNWQTQNIN